MKETSRLFISHFHLQVWCIKSQNMKWLAYSQQQMGPGPRSQTSVFLLTYQNSQLLYAFISNGQCILMLPAFDPDTKREDKFISADLPGGKTVWAQADSGREGGSPPDPPAPCPPPISQAEWCHWSPRWSSQAWVDSDQFMVLTV